MLVFMFEDVKFGRSDLVVLSLGGVVLIGPSQPHPITVLRTVLNLLLCTAELLLI